MPKTANTSEIQNPKVPQNLDHLAFLETLWIIPIFEFIKLKFFKNKAKAISYSAYNVRNFLLINRIENFHFLLKIVSNRFSTSCIVEKRFRARIGLPRPIFLKSRFLEKSGFFFTQKVIALSKSFCVSIFISYII